MEIKIWQMMLMEWRSLSSKIQVNRLLLVVGLAFLPPLLFAQTAKEVFSSETLPITYLGIDFSHARLTGDSGADVEAIQKRHFSSINKIITNEPKKFNLHGAFHKSNISNDISFAEERNAAIDPAAIVCSPDNFKRISDVKLARHIEQQYDFKERSGVGLLIIVEELDRVVAMASMFIVFVEMKSRKVLFIHRESGRSGGFGFSNYWARSIFEVLDEFGKTQYPLWNKQYQ